MTQPNQMPPLTPELVKKRIDMAMRGVAFLTGTAVSLTVAFTGVGSWVNALQASFMDGSYSPKLTVAVVMLTVGVPAFVATYLVLRRLWAPKLVANLNAKLSA